MSSSMATTCRTAACFAGLLAYQDEDFYRSGSGCFTLYTPDGVRRYQIFAVQFADDASPLYSLGFANDRSLRRIFAAGQGGFSL